MSDREEALHDLIRLIAEWVVSDFEREQAEAQPDEQEAQDPVAG